MAIESIPNSRFVRHTVDDLTLGERPDHLPSPHYREADTRFPYQPNITSAEGLPENLVNALNGSHYAARELRRIADEAWQTEPDVKGVFLTAAQRQAVKRVRVAEAVQYETEKTLARLRPVIERSRAELLSRREKLMTKGNIKLSDTAAQKAMLIGQHFASLPAETRTLRILDALNSLDQPASRELAEAIAWCGENLDLVSPETLSRIRGALVASDPDYATVVKLEAAVNATEESLSVLERFAQELPGEYDAPVLPLGNEKA